MFAGIVLPFSCCRSCLRCFCERESQVLDDEDLEPVMARMREQLISRNVASEVARDIVASVRASLLDQKLKSFTRYASSNASC